MDKREFILRLKASGDARSVATLSAFYDTTAAQIEALPPPAPTVPDETPRIESDKVSAWLASLRDGNTAQRARFADLRRAPFVDQRAAWVVAGSP